MNYPDLFAQFLEDINRNLVYVVSNFDDYECTTDGPCEDCPRFTSNPRWCAHDAKHRKQLIADLQLHHPEAFI